MIVINNSSLGISVLIKCNKQQENDVIFFSLLQVLIFNLKNSWIWILACLGKNKRRQKNLRHLMSKTDAGFYFLDAKHLVVRQELLEK